MGEKEGTIYIFKNPPPHKRGRTPMLSNKAEAVQSCWSCLFLRACPALLCVWGTAAGSRRGFLRLYRVYIKNQLKR